MPPERPRGVVPAVIAVIAVRVAPAGIHVGVVATYLGLARAHVGVTSRPRSCLA